MYEEIISLFLKINPHPSDHQFHCFAEALGCDKETLESISYSMLSNAEDLLEDPMVASLVHQINANARIHAQTHVSDKNEDESTAQETLNDPTVDPDDLPLADVALNDGDPTDDDLGLQDETQDDGYSEHDVGVGLTNNANDVLTDDGVPDISL